MDSEVYRGIAPAILGIALATLGEVLVEELRNTGTARLTERVPHPPGLALIIGGAATVALAYVFPAIDGERASRPKRQAPRRWRPAGTGPPFSRLPGARRPGRAPERWR